MDLYPVVLEHAAAFVRQTPWAVSRDAELLAAAHRAAYGVYGQSPVVCGMDVYNVEAEAWGATVVRPDGNGVPTLGVPPLADVAELGRLGALDPERDGRLPVYLGAARRLRDACPLAEVRVPLAGPFSIAVGLLGFETVLLALIDQPTALGEGLLHLATRQAELAIRLAAFGFGVTLYESAATPPMVPPFVFEALELPALRRVLQAVPMACVLGGNVEPVAALLLAAGPAAVICPAETDQAAFLKEAAAWPEIAVRVNLPAAVVASGERERVLPALRQAARLAQGHPRATLGTGVLSYETDPAWICELRRLAAE